MAQQFVSTKIAGMLLVSLVAHAQDNSQTPKSYRAPQDISELKTTCVDPVKSSFGIKTCFPNWLESPDAKKTDPTNPDELVTSPENVIAKDLWSCTQDIINGIKTKAKWADAIIFSRKVSHSATYLNVDPKTPSGGIWMVIPERFLRPTKLGCVQKNEMIAAIEVEINHLKTQFERLSDSQLSRAAKNINTIFKTIETGTHAAATVCTTDIAIANFNLREEASRFTSTSSTLERMVKPTQASDANENSPLLENEISLEEVDEQKKYLTTHEKELKKEFLGRGIILDGDRVTFKGKTVSLGGAICIAAKAVAEKYRQKFGGNMMGMPMAIKDGKFDTNPIDPCGGYSADSALEDESFNLYDALGTRAQQLFLNGEIDENTNLTVGPNGDIVKAPIAPGCKRQLAGVVCDFQKAQQIYREAYRNTYGTEMPDFGVSGIGGVGGGTKF